MKKYKLDGKNFKSRKGIYDYMEGVFEFPEYFGKNLDALWDLLSFEKDLRIEIENAREIPRNLGDYGLNILDVFGDLDDIEGNVVTIKW